MARVTVEDCLKNVDNRFDLVLKAAKRAHLLEVGAVDPMVSADNDKPTVIALREIAAGFDVTKQPDERENEVEPYFHQKASELEKQSASSEEESTY